MKTIYFDCFSGISGDMILGALIDAGVDEEAFKKELGKLNLKGYEIKINRESRNGIMAANVTVEFEHNHFHNRNIKDIELIIESSKLSQWVKKYSIKAFRILAEAEAAVHNMSVEQIHFHEVGAVDAIVDVTGAFICMELLKVEQVFCSKLTDGYGFISCHHGKLPVPVPAVVEISKRNTIPIVQIDIDTELVTPTGISIVAAAAAGGFGLMPEITIQHVGYGLGKKKISHPNMLRVIIGDVKEDKQGTITTLQANIDDMNSEILGFVMEGLFAQGVLDVFYTPIYMKKNRPGVLITVLCNSEDAERLSNYIFRETTTTGIRFFNCERYKMDRELMVVSTSFGDIKVKISKRDDVLKLKPEYEDCRKVALEQNIPINEVIKEVEHTAKENIRNNNKAY